MVKTLMMTFSLFLCGSLFTQAFSAETVRFRYVSSIYRDDKGIGMKQPEGVACNDQSQLLVADSGNGRLLQYLFQDKTAKEGKEIKIPQLPYPVKVQINSKGELFALDGKQRRIIRLNRGGEYKGYVSAEGLPSPSSFIPRSFKIDSKDNIYILDIFSARVILLSPDGKYQKQIEFPKGHGFFSDLTVDVKGNILLVDSTKLAVFSAPRDGNNFSQLGGNLKEYLNFPGNMTVDSRGTIYLVDENGSGIVVLGQEGNFMGRLLSMGWTEGLLYYPSQMSLNDKGEVFIADRGNSRVQVFNVTR